MAWTTPKNDFLATDGYTNTHANNVGENQRILHQGNYAYVNITAANDIDIGQTVHSAYITGSTTINRISYSDGSGNNRGDGNVIFLLFGSSCTLNLNVAAGGIYCGMRGNTTSVSQYACIGFLFRYPWWYEIKAW